MVPHASVPTLESLLSDTPQYTDLHQSDRSIPIQDGPPKIEPEAIAIVGMSFKLPGSCDTDSSLWDVLTSARCVATPFPEARLSAAALYHPSPSKKGTLPFQGAHFLSSDISKFDAPFFSISENEAASLDPMQRLLLETSYRALENAGLPIESVAGSKTAVYTGCFTNDWRHQMLKDSEQCLNHTAIGIEQSILANRISWFYDFKGTSFNVDSACSSSLVALDLACKNLISGASDMGIAAGCNLIFYPDILHALSNYGLLSPDNHSYSFDSRANGYARGEGIVVLVLKRMSDALANNDMIRAVIRSTGSGSDGYTSQISQPSGKAQAELIRSTYAQAGLALDDTAYIEAHGTGTRAGDPIEAGAIGSVFTRSRSSETPLYVGAIKANIGHLEGAAGLAGVVKTVLILESGVIPPNANFVQVNPRIDEHLLRIRFPRIPTLWPREGLRRASVNSFGFGGTNAHAILDDAYHYLQKRRLVGNHRTIEKPQMQTRPSRKLVEMKTGDMSEVEVDAKVLILSASDQQALKKQIQQFARHFQATAEDQEFHSSYRNDLAYTLNSRRSALSWRSFALVSSIDDLTKLESCSAAPVKSSSQPSLGLLFTGQGAQYAGSTLRSLQQFPAFRTSIEEAEGFLRTLGCTWHLREELFAADDHSNIDKPEYAQPISTALQVALVDLLRSLGVHPTVVVGHSSGEIAAAYSVGAISASSAWKIGYYRGYHTSRLARSDNQADAMMAAGLSATEVQPYIDEIGTGRLVVACINSSKNITLSGPANEIDVLQKRLSDEGFFARKLKVDIAYHSPAIEPTARAYSKSLGKLTRGEATTVRTSMISTVTGKRVTHEQLCSSQYWVENMVSPVRFSEALGGLHFRPGGRNWKKMDLSHLNHTRTTFLLELGFHGALRGYVRDILSEAGAKGDVSYASALTRGQSPVRTLRDSLGQLYAHGYKLDLHALNLFKSHPSLLSDLPAYEFNHSKSYWEEGRISKRFRLHPQGHLDLLGKPCADWNPLEAKWRNVIRISEMGWVEDHRINGALILPAAGMLVMAIEAANQMADSQRAVNGFEIKDVTFLKTLMVPAENGVETQLFLRQLPDATSSTTPWSEFRVCSFEMEEWQENCRGSIRPQYERAAQAVTQNRETEFELAKCKRAIDSFTGENSVAFDAELFYRTLKESGYGFGPSFQRIQSGALKSRREAMAQISLYDWTTYYQPHVIHPCTLDSLMHLSAAISCEGGTRQVPTSIPNSIRKMWVSRTGLNCVEQSCVKAIANMTKEDSRGNNADISAMDPVGKQILAQISDLRFTTIAESEASSSDENRTQTCYRLTWKPDVTMMEKEQLELYCSEAGFKDSEPVHFYQELTSVLVAFLFKATKEVPKSSIDPTSHLCKYIEWAEMTLASFASGTLPNSRPDWARLQSDDEAFEQACTRVSAFNDFGRVYVTVGQALNAILRGEIDALDHLFSNDLLPTLYRELNENRTCFPEFARYLDAYSHKNPSMRILEIGAGTGATTKQILQTLCAEGPSRYASYHYTDVSPSFFEEARANFTAFPNLTFQTLDIGKDPRGQGFDDASFDFIVAANVLHVTDDITRTMQYVRRLIRPGGVLLMYEPTRPDLLRTNFITGLLPGWWLGKEPERKWGAALHSDAWNRVLRDTGFTGIDAELPEFHAPECREASLIVSTANTSRERVDSDVIIVTNNESHSHEGVALRLQEAIAECGSDCQITSLEGAATSEHLPNSWIIFLQELLHPVLDDLSEAAFTMTRRVLSSSKGVLWVNGGGDPSSHPGFGMASGLLRTLRNEDPDRICAIVSLDTRIAVTADHILHMRKIFQNLRASKDPFKEDMEYRSIGVNLSIPRVVQDKSMTQEVERRSRPMQDGVRTLGECPPITLAIGSPGFLDTLHFVQDSEFDVPLSEMEVEIQVRAIGLNFMDCLMALGRVPDTKFGAECSGIITRLGPEAKAEGRLQIGDRVTMCSGNTFRTFARGHARRVVPIGDIEFTAAASVPVQFCTAWQSLHEVARLREGESILVHAGAGGTGQAAIQVARSLGATVYATVGSEMKKQVLMREYDIPEERIFYSRDTSFAEAVMHATQGRGVDVILNSMAGDSLVASWECIARYGRFIEIGKKDIIANSDLPMHVFSRNASFTAFDGYTWQYECPEQANSAIQAVLKLFGEGKLHTVRPLHVLGLDEVEKSFRSLQDGKMAGKMVLEVNPSAAVRSTLPTLAGFSLQSHSTYVIAGGFGGLGRSISRWLFERGARNFILLSRSGPKSEEAKALVDELQEKGAAIVAEACDITDRARLQAVLSLAEKHGMPPIKGCLQASIVLRDSEFRDMTHSDWTTATKCKTIGSWNLHKLLPLDLDFFIMLSSTSGIVGLHGQSNYAAGNTFLDALARHRTAKGQKAVSLDLGAMLDDGILAENPELLKRVLAYGTLDGISRSQFFALLDYYCNPALQLRPFDETQLVIGIGQGGKDDVLEWKQAMFRHVNASTGGTTSKAQVGGSLEQDWKAALSTCASYSEAVKIVDRALIQKLQRALSINPDDFDLEKPLSAYGVDSLLSVELRRWISREMSADVAVFEISGASSFAVLSGLVASRSRVGHAGWSH